MNSDYSNSEKILEVRRKLSQAISTVLISVIIFVFSPQGPLFFGEPWRVYWTMGFVFGRYLVFQLIKFDYLKKFSEIEQNFMRRDGHKHTWKCLLEPDVVILFFIPFINAAILWRAVLLVLIDVYACIIGVLLGRHEFLEEKTIQGSIGALLCISITLFLFTPFPIIYVLFIALIGIIFEALSPKLILKDNFYLALVGVITFIIFSNITGALEIAIDPTL